ncbi:MAG: isopentenyl-diphosphate Delta-isomerase [Nitriliruptoraceae bacterium]|nr:isopentenyl-diphosphate Delta-isomerase [Nitriliruptoraceae bacterium]
MTDADRAAERHVVVLDDDAQPTGSMPKLAAHQGEGRRHLAFSVVLQDPDGRLLLQRRAETKHHFAGDWANTCCSHPSPGEGVQVAARRRLGEELGIRTAPSLAAWNAFSYRARDERSGLIEVEYDVVVRGRVPADLPLEPDPTEVAEVAWFTPSEIDRLLDDPGRRVAPWFPLVLAALRGGPGPIAPGIPL